MIYVVRERNRVVHLKKKVRQFLLIFYEEILELKYFQSRILAPSLELI